MYKQREFFCFMTNVFVITQVLVLQVKGLTAPTLTISCNSNKEITMTGQKNFTNMLVINGNELCKTTNANLLPCNNKSPVEILYGGQHINNTVSGKDFLHIRLTCSDKPYLSNGTVEILNQVNPTVGHKYTATVPRVHLNLELYGKQGLLNSKTVKIGEQLSLKMEGPENHFLSPTLCTANAKDHTEVRYDMWKSSPTCTGDISMIDAKWVKEKNNIIKISVYAFRFLKYRSVVIECSAYVCPTIDGCNQDCIKNSTRRRRSVEKYNTHPQLQNAKVSFEIKDEFLNSNNSPGITGSKCTLGILWISMLISIWI